MCPYYGAVYMFLCLWVVGSLDASETESGDLSASIGLLRSEPSSKGAARKKFQRSSHVSLEHHDSQGNVSLSVTQSGTAASVAKKLESEHGYLDPTNGILKTYGMERHTVPPEKPLDAKRASKQSETNIVQDVLFYDFHSPYRNERSSRLGKQAMDWMVMLRADCAQQQQKSVCVNIPGEAECLAQAVGGIGFVHMRASPEALQVWLSFISPQARGCVDFVEPDGELTVIPETATHEPPDASANAEHLRRRIFRTEFGKDPNHLPANRGEGVHIYIADTGIRYTHTSFLSEDGSWRAKPTLDVTAVPLKECQSLDGACAWDNHGHGTHAAGIAAGQSFGVAPHAKVHGVKISNDHGISSRSAFVAALDWVITQGAKPAVFSLAVSSPGVSHAIEAAIEAASRQGVTVVVAAGDGNEDACGIAPAYVHGAITVGASDPFEAKASSSNYGNCVDIFVPGTDIESPAQGDDISSLLRSGTSVACSLVAGAAAILLSDKPKADVKSRLLGSAKAKSSNAETLSPRSSVYLGDDFFGLATSEPRDMSGLSVASSNSTNASSNATNTSSTSSNATNASSNATPFNYSHLPPGTEIVPVYVTVVVTTTVSAVSTTITTTTTSVEGDGDGGDGDGGSTTNTTTATIAGDGDGSGGSGGTWW
mmetsp:Transcript_392/g.577  ORF Transcript_392/g.577 Transcript_392/m.577 type:complete len:653 (+) Transcript_392:71-2029(+)